MEKDLIDKHTIFLTVHGSHAYGLNTPESDKDIRGVMIPPKEYFYGFLHKIEQYESKSPDDLVIYEIRKFFNLCCDCNPNMIELPFISERFWIKTSNYWYKILEHRDKFISKKAKFTFSGYAFAQMKRIQTHKKWLLDPPKKRPERKDFGLSDRNIISKEKANVIVSLGDKFNDELVELARKEMAFHEAIKQWEQYQIWKTNRNPVRAELEAKYGYDTKHACHLVRLMVMCKEILQGKGVIVYRENDKDLFLEIKNGLWSYEQLMEWFERINLEIEELYETSTIPNSPDRVALDNLCQEIVVEFLSKEV